jgi:hypothetical protein
MKLNQNKVLKSYKTNEANKAKNIEKMTNRIEAKFLKNRENGKNLTKPIEPVTIFPFAKSQNEANLKYLSYKTISFKMLSQKNTLFPKRIAAKSFITRSP